MKECSTMPRRADEPALAVLTPRWGAPSETFIRSHITSILPGRTIAASRAVVDGDWCPGVPLLEMGKIRDWPVDRLARLCGWWRYDRRARALRDFLERHHTTVVLGEWLNFSAYWIGVVRDLGLRFFAHAHGYDVTEKALSRAWHAALYRRLKEADGVITFSELSRQRLLDSVKLESGRVHVIPYGVDVPAEPLLRGEREQVICLHVGRMVEKKGPLITVKAFQAAHRVFPALRLEMIGNGPLLKSCQRYCAEQGLEDVVTFHGGQQSAFVKQRLAQSDMLLLHSLRARNGDEEGLPVAILEGMAHSLPVVSTLHAGIPEAVLEGDTGFLLREGDVGTMAERMIELARDSDLRRRMGLAGYNRALQMFSAERELRELGEVLFGDGAFSGQSKKG